jgi:GT2 family glycosyltransferase
VQKVRSDRPSIGVVIVSYNSDEVLQRCIDSLAEGAASVAHNGERIPVVVIDNASAVRPTTSIAQHLDIQVVDLPENLGFSPAVNIGVEHLPDVEWILLLNPDAQLESDTLTTMLSEGRQHNAALVGPVLVSTDGKPSGFSERAFHSLHRELAHQFVPIRQTKRSVGRRAMRTGDARCLTGACLMIESEFLRSIGGLDTEIRMYLEDVELCWRAHELGRAVRLARHARCVHGLGGSSKGVNFRTADKLHMTLLAARVEFVRRRAGKFGGGLMRFAMGAGAALRICVTRLSGREPARHVSVLQWAIKSGRAPEWTDA